jgi:hypothetical protein
MAVQGATGQIASPAYPWRSQMTKDEGLVGSLNDSCFVHASECLTKICQMIEEEAGEKPSLHDLCELLAVSLRGCSGDLLSDINVQAVEKLTPKVAPHKKVTLKPGAILAIPRKMGGFYFVIYITTNQFGDAFGIFDGHRQVPYVSSRWKPVPAKFPVYTGKALVVSGRWSRIDHREDLLDLFPKSPEIYHSKSDNPSNDRIGPYGSGETVTGELRELTESEAKQIGLIQGTYRQVMLEEEFEKYLQETLG